MLHGYNAAMPSIVPLVLKRRKAMKHNLPKHTERIRTRHALNGMPYPDNPKGLPYNNDGVLIEVSPERKSR